MTDNLQKGGQFLLEDTNLNSIFIPEEFTEEDKMYAKTAEDFINNEVLPRFEDIESQKDGLLPELIRKAGGLGLSMVDVPEKYDGLELSKKTSLLITEKIFLGGSFATGLGAHAGIGSLPIVYFGSDEQKKKYVPLLAQCVKLGAYAFTEANAGTDALAGKTKAVLSSDGKYYILNGEKVFITNGGFADIFIVFAKIDGEKFTAFIVEKEFKGLSTGVEEKKMGIKGWPLWRFD
jgi:alkylation response protein AidB-like acyl-CoA dehydrogenase